MAERRSLTTAVSNPVAGVDPEIVRSFVTQNIISERPAATTIAIANELSKKHSDACNDLDSRAGISSEPIVSRFRRVALIPVTIRLRSEIAGALKRASLERELEGEDIFTQQDLVESALEPWLRQNGFLK